MCASCCSVLLGCNGDEKDSFNVPDSSYDTDTGEEEYVSIFDPKLVITPIALAFGYDTSSFDIGSLFESDSKLTVATMGGKYLDSSVVELNVGVNTFQVLYERGYATKAYEISLARRDTYRVVLNANSGSYVENQYVAPGDTLDLTDSSLIPKRDGYSFLGWHDKNGNNVTLLKAKGDTVLTAYWQSPTTYKKSDKEIFSFDTSSAAINIVWKDYDNAFASRPETIYCTLYDTVQETSFRVGVTRNTAEFIGAAPEGAVISQGAGIWTVKITGLEGDYTFTQDKLSTDKYTSTQSGTTVVNTMEGYQLDRDETAWLMTAGSRLYDYSGNVIVLKGVVTIGIGNGSFSADTSKTALKRLIKEGVNTIRVTMNLDGNANTSYLNVKGTDENGNQTITPQTQEGRQKVLDQMMTSIENATSLGMYYIIDWGTLNENPADRQTEAVEYFSMLAEKYRDNPYLIFEICNEPAPDIWNRTEGTGGVRTYAEAVIGAIRAKESDALVIVAPDGSATNISDWVSSSIAGNDPIDDPINTLLAYNVAYTFHLYAWNYEYSTTTTHYGYRIRDAIEAGLTVIYTEFSPAIATMDAQYSGRLEMDTKEADKYLNLALEYDMSYMFFRYISFFASQETSSQHMFEKGHKNELANGSWTYEMLTDSGKWFYDNALHTDGFIRHADYKYVPPVR